MYTAKLTVIDVLKGTILDEHKITGAKTARLAHDVALELYNNIKHTYKPCTDAEISVYADGYYIDEERYLDNPDCD